MTENLPAVLRGEAAPKRVGDRRRAKLMEAADRITALEARAEYLDRCVKCGEDLLSQQNHLLLTYLRDIENMRVYAKIATSIALVFALSLIACAVFFHAGCGR